MFRRSPRAAVLGALAVVVAIVTATIVFDALASLRHQDQTYGTLREVVVAGRDLTVGTQLRRTDLEVRRLRGDPPAPGAVTDPGRVEGHVVRVPLLRGATITARHLTAAHRPGLGGVVPAGRRAFRLVVEHGLRPTPGDLVDVLATFDPQTLGDGRDPTVLVAAAATVLASEPASEGSDTVAVTVLVTPAVSRRLAFSAATGTLSLALAPPEAGGD